MHMDSDSDPRDLEEGTAFSDGEQKEVIPTVDFDYDAIDAALGVKDFPDLKEFSDRDYVIASEMLQKLLEWCCAPPTPLYRGFRIGVLMFLLRPGEFDEAKTLAELSRKWGKNPMYMQLHVRALKRLAPRFHAIGGFTESGRQALIDSYHARTGAMDPARVSARFRALKKDTGMTYKSLGKLLGVGGVTVFNACKGRHITDSLAELLNEAEPNIRATLK